MKKLIVAAMLLCMGTKAFAQDDFPKHEVNLNILNVIWLASVELGYEHYISFNQSLEGEIFINDQFSFLPKKSGEKYNATSFKVGYNYYFDSSDAVGFYINPFLKTRFGKYTKDGEEDKNLNAFIIGVGVGYTWVFNSKFVVAPYANIARGFNNEVNKEYLAVEPNAGVRLGFRF